MLNNGERKNLTGNKIKQLRIERGMSQYDLVIKCELLGYPMTQNMISRIENGKRYVTDIEIWVMMHVFRVTSASLFEECTGQENEEVEQKIKHF